MIVNTDDEVEYLKELSKMNDFEEIPLIDKLEYLRWYYSSEEFDYDEDIEELRIIIDRIIYKLKGIEK